MGALPILLAALLAAPAGGDPPSLAALAGELGSALGPPTDGRRGLALLVEARAPALAAPLEAALSEALTRQGYSVAPARPGGDAEAAARAAGQDWLLRVQAGLVPGRRELLLVGEVIPAWESFFLQRPGARPRPPRLVRAHGPADAETLLLGREQRPPGTPFARLRTLGRVAGRVLSLAVGDLGQGQVLLAATPEADLLLSASGQELARRELDRGGWTPVRDPAAAVAVGDFGPGPLAVQHAGAPLAEVLAWRGDRLEPVGTLAAAPLCASPKSALFGRFAEGEGLLLDALAAVPDPQARPRSDRRLYAVAAAPRPGPIAFAALDADLRLELLGPDLAPAAPPIPGVGVGFALADLDGDGTAEVVASAPSAGGEDRLRVLAPLSRPPLVLESDPLPGAVLAGAAGDLTGDGIDDAVLALVSSAPGGPTVTDLLLLTSDPRELP